MNLYQEVTIILGSALELSNYLTKKKGFSPAKVVGVVGLGHIGGIKENWTKDFNIDHLK